MQRLFEAAEIAKFNKQERLEYEDTLKAYRDWFSVMETAEKKGEAKGRAEGEYLKTIELARGFKKAGTPIEVIIQVTGLSTEEIAGL